MARNLLTVAQIKASSKPKLRDGEGLWLHTSKSGKRYWVFIFTRHGRRREMGLGPYDYVSLAEARRKADEARNIIHRGGDPFAEMADRQVTVKPKTFGEVADEYISDAVEHGKWRGKKTEAGWRNTLTNHAKPLRKISVAEITTDDVLRVLRPLWTEKHETATKVRERIRMVLDAAKVRGLRSGDNPAQWKGHLDHILSVPADRGGHHASMPYAEVPDFMQRLAKVGGVGARALEFTVLTGARSGETRGAVWDEIDLERRLWIVPANRMKSGREHRVPLSDRALSILMDANARKMSDLIFPSIKSGAQLSDMTLAKALKSAGSGKFTVHGMRATFRTWTQEVTDYPSELAEAALAHVSGDAVLRAYARGDVLERRRSMMEDWARHCVPE